MNEIQNRICKEILFTLGQLKIFIVLWYYQLTKLVRLKPHSTKFTVKSPNPPLLSIKPSIQYTNTVF